MLKDKAPTSGSRQKTLRVRKSEATRKRILDAAAILFGDQGYTATTLRQIAKRARIDAGSIYYYFASKEEILDEVMEIGIRSVSEAVEQAVGELPPEASNRRRLEVAVETHMYTLLRYSAYTSANIAIFAQVSRKAQDRNRLLRKRYAAFWNDIFEAAQDAGEISAAADLSLVRLFLLGSVNWSMQWYDPKKKNSIDELAHSFCTMLFDGIGPK
ncbi:MAG: TetR/AcrR family transcriptional regulator [Rhodospirillaceae bacterium]|nr:TetR/AcrR family transcriptional regulator [Rhodospirillaceae bacterium]